MPELPEVENMRLSLLPYCNNLIDKTIVKNPNLRQKVNSTFIKDLTNTTFKKIERIGKYLIFFLSNNKYLLIHAGMSGKFIINYSKKGIVNSKHTHIEFHFNNKVIIGFNDPRRFGLALTFNDKKTIFKKINLGIDALSTDLTFDYLNTFLKKSTMDIKTFLLKQNILAGIGNIYANEILFHSKIHPLSKTNNLTNKEITLLVNNIKAILKKAIKLGGSTLKDYKKPNGEVGNFQFTFSVYNRNNLPCVTCNTLIKKITLKGRSTYLCPKEQLLQ